MGEHGTLSLAKQIGDNPSAYSLDQLRGAISRLIEAKHRSRHSARAQVKAERRLDEIRRELGLRERRINADYDSPDGSQLRVGAE